jgi:hypothetical protein
MLMNDLYKWSKQAFGVTGFLLGWTGFFQKKIQQQAQESLNTSLNKQKNNFFDLLKAFF